MPAKRIKCLVVDTSAFIKGAPLQDIADSVVTVQEVIDEVTSKKQLRKLIVLPYDLKVKDVFTENIKFITDFSKKTGDYTSLSATDIKVMALTYQLEKEEKGTDHLKTEPTTQRTIKVTGLGQPFKKEGDGLKQEEIDKANGTNDIQNTEDAEDNDHVQDCEIEKGQSHLEETNNAQLLAVEKNSQYETTHNSQSSDLRTEDNITEQLNVLNLKDDNVDSILIKAEDSETEPESGEDGSESDGGDWITPGNIEQKKKEMDMDDYFDGMTAEVACITTDFAMQNVLKQIGLHVTSIDGKLIRHVRTYIFRCTTCFKTTSVMTKVFCPKCGHATLKKVAVSIDEHGNQQIHINGRKPLTARGKRFSLPTPRGGQHFQYPVLTEDQHLHNRQATRLARMKNNPLDPDYIAGYSPFTVRDVNSKSAVLGVRNCNNQDIKQWMRKSANDVRKKKK